MAGVLLTSRKVGCDEHSLVATVVGSGELVAACAINMEEVDRIRNSEERPRVTQLRAVWREAVEVANSRLGREGEVEDCVVQLLRQVGQSSTQLHGVGVGHGGVDGGQPKSAGRDRKL